MRVHVSRPVSRRPLAIAIGVSIGFHLLLLAIVLLVRPPANPYMVKRGEPLFIELPKAEEPAERGSPPAASLGVKAPPSPPAPPAVKAQPQPRVAASQPQPAPGPPRAPQPPPPRAPAPPAAASAPRYNDYLDRVRRMIKEKWGYPCIKDVSTGNCDYKSARLVIVFGILRDGRVPTLEVAQQSGYAIYDDYAKNAIRLAAPFPPV